MTPSSSVSTPRSSSWVPPAHSFKSDREESYFSQKHNTPASGPSTYSTIPISTPLAVTTSPTSPNSPNSNKPEYYSYNSPLGPHTDPEMLQRLARCFPAPPTLSLSSIPNPLRRAGATAATMATAVTTPPLPPPDPFAPHVSTCHRPAPALPAAAAAAIGGGGATMSMLPQQGPESIPSPMDRSRRSPAPSYVPAMDISSLPGKHTFHVQLPQIIQPEMITISANKGDRLKVVADAWHMESDCHYEWQITFAPRDIDMTAIHARFEANGHLFIDVRRHAGAGSSYVIGR